MTEEMKKPGNAATLAPAETNHYRNNTTKEQIVSMLEDLLKHCDEDVLALIPAYNKRGELETIEVAFCGGGTRYANVYADSHLAICRDVLNQVFR
jgi:hypothetical protein